MMTRGKSTYEELLIHLAEAEETIAVLRDEQVDAVLSKQRVFTVRLQEAEDALLKITYELGERIKELDCLYNLSSLTNRLNLTADDLCRAAIELIPPAWAHPDITCARITLKDREFRSKNFKETAWKLTSDIVVHGEQIGSFEVGHLEEKSEADGGPFLKEERSLINAITEQLGLSLDRIQTGQALHESEADYRDLATSITDVFFAMDKELKYTFWNKASEELTGVLAKDAIGKSILEIFPNNEGTRRAIDIYREVLKTQKSQIFMNDYELNDKHFFFEISVYPTKNGISVFTRDVTDKKTTEMALEASEAKYRSLTENLNVGVYRNTPGPRGEFVEVNPAIVEMFGYANREDYLATQVAEHYQNPRDRESFDEKILRDGFVKNEEVNLKKKDGTPIIASVTAVAVKDEINDVQYYDGIIEDIMQRKNLEDDLKESEEKYRNLIENSKDSFVVIDLDGNIQFANKASEELTGYSIEEDIEMNVKDITPLKYWPKSLIVLKRAREGIAVPYFESMIRKKDGSLIPVESGGQPLMRNGKITGIQIITRDITERKRAEEAIKASQERYRELVEMAGVAIMIDDEEGDIVYFNDRFAELRGYSVEEMKEQSIETLIHPDDVERVRTYHRQRMEGVETPHRYEFKGLKKDGSVVHLEVDVVPLEEEEEEEEEVITGTRSYFWDVTHRKRTEELLRESEERFRSIFEQAAESFVLVDVDTGGFVEFNDMACENLGYTRKEFAGLKIPDFEVVESTEEVEKHIEKIVKEGSASFLTKHRTKDGDVRDIQVSSRALTLHGRKYIQSVWRDITSQKLVEEELLRSHNQLRLLSARIQSAREEDRSNIAREIHDELGQNLTAIKMDLSWLQKELPPDRGELFEKMETISKLVDDTVQRVKRISAELRPGLLDDLGIAAAVEWQAEEFQRVSGIECQLILDQEDLVLDGDSTTALFRVFQEILSNVARHSGASKVGVNLSTKSDWVTLEVSDNGRGIRIAEIESPTALGILGMQERISHLGGKFDITGRGGKGTKVRVRVPFARKESAR